MNLLNPYASADFSAALRGNLHAHSTLSDGSRSPQAVIDDYARRGYGFLMLSDHDKLADEVLYAALNPRGLLLIPGNEITANGPHLLHVNASRRIEPNPLRQQAINDALADRGFVIVNHPNWESKFDHCPLAKMQEWVGYLGLEIFNGVIGRLDGSAYALDKWDRLLSAGRRLWGFAVDDSHGPGDVELGWCVALPRQRTVQGVLDALVSGCFYCSTGVEITRIGVDGDHVRVEAPQAHRIVALQQFGKRFAVADASSIEVAVPPDARYVRFECWGSGEQFAWTQPFFVAG